MLATTTAAEPEPPALSTPEMIAGRVIDVAGKAVAGVELGLRESSGSSFDEDGFGASIWREDLRTDLEPVAVSGPDGRFAFPRQQGRFGSLVSQDERWESVLAPYAIRPEDERIVVVAPRFRLEGRVRPHHGDALRGRELRAGPGRGHGDHHLGPEASGGQGGTSDDDEQIAFVCINDQFYMQGLCRFAVQAIQWFIDTYR